MVKNNTVSATGRRKLSVARVRLSEGTGLIQVNGKNAEDYFGTALQIELLKKPFETIGALGKYDVIASVTGGGKSGQCGAVVHGASRALSSLDDEIKAVLKKSGFLTRDQPGARKRFQFSKR